MTQKLTPEERQELKRLKAEHEALLKKNRQLELELAFINKLDEIRRRDKINRYPK